MNRPLHPAAVSGAFVTFPVDDEEKRRTPPPLLAFPLYAVFIPNQTNQTNITQVIYFFPIPNSQLILLSDDLSIYP